MRVSSGWKLVFQTDERGSIPLIRSKENDEPILWVRIAACKAASEGSIPSRLSTQLDRDGLVTLSSLIRSSHCVRFAGDPLIAALAV